MRVPGCLGVVGSLREGTSASSSEGNGIGGRPAGEQSGSKGGGAGRRVKMGELGDWIEGGLGWFGSKNNNRQQIQNRKIGEMDIQGE